MNRWFLLFVGLLVVAIVGYAVFKSRSGAHAAAPPEIPADVTDPPIWKVIAAKRAAVIADPRSATAWGELGMAFDAHERWVLHGLLSGRPGEGCVGAVRQYGVPDPVLPHRLVSRLAASAADRDRGIGEPAETARCERD